MRLLVNSLEIAVASKPNRAIGPDEWRAVSDLPIRDVGRLRVRVLVSLAPLFVLSPVYGILRVFSPWTGNVLSGGVALLVPPPPRSIKKIVSAAVLQDGRTFHSNSWAAQCSSIPRGWATWGYDVEGRSHGCGRRQINLDAGNAAPEQVDFPVIILEQGGVIAFRKRLIFGKDLVGADYFIGHG